MDEEGGDGGGERVGRVVMGRVMMGVVIEGGW